MSDSTFLFDVKPCKHGHSTASIWQRLAAVWLALLALWMSLTFHQHGISNDEYVQHTYGQLLLQWYRSGFTEMAAFHFRNLYLYGGLFDLLAAWLEPLTTLWVWDLRHALTAVFGWLGFYGIYRFACLLGDVRLGLLSLGLLTITVSWSGTLFTHTKDIPFATCMLWASYASALVARDLSHTRLRTSLLLGLAVGAALGLRIGAAFAVLQLLLVLAWQYWRSTPHPPLAGWTWSLLTRLLPAMLLAWLVMAICWPWSMMAPDNILQAVRSFAHFAFNMQTMLNGQAYGIGEVPRSYLFQYLMVKLPELSLLGLLALPLAAWLKVRDAAPLNPSQQAAMRTLLVSLLLPLAYVLYDKPALYNGVRHFTFVLPLLTLLAAWGWLTVYDHWRKQCRHWSAALIGVSLGLSAYTVSDMVQLHPYEYIRLNRLAGDHLHAQYRWEGDYWSSALLAASAQLQALPLPARAKPYLVAACVDTPQITPYLDARRFQITRDWEIADFFVSTTHMHCHQVLQGTLVGQVQRQGMTLAVVKDRRQLQGEARKATPAKN